MVRRYRYIVKDNNYFIAAGRHTKKACRDFIAATAEHDPQWASAMTIWEFDCGEYFRIS